MPALQVHTQPVSLSQRALSRDECRSWLAHHRFGRLGFMSGRGRRSVAVSYALRSDTVVVRVGDYNDIARYAPDAQVTLDVDGFALKFERRPGVRNGHRRRPRRPSTAQRRPRRLWLPGVAGRSGHDGDLHSDPKHQRDRGAAPQAAEVIRPPSRSTTTHRTATPSNS
jgi:hypothetical protein